jgi:fluoroquinolone transport system permease protein
VSRLVATLGLDVKLQSRYSVYTIILVVAALLSGALGYLFTPSELHFFMPVVLLGGVNLTTVFLAGFLVLLERDEGTLDVVLVSPLRPTEYLWAKMVSLTALAIVEGAVIVVVAYGFGFNLGWLLSAIVLRAMMGVCIGVVIGLRYRTITRFLMPAILVSLTFDLPILWYLGMIPTDLMYLWPAMPSMILAKAAFFGADPWQMAYAFLWGTSVLIATVVIGNRSIRGSVVGGQPA